MSMSATLASNTPEATSRDVESVTPYQVISLLLDGALERIDQAITSLSDGDIDDAALLINKTIGIINGLRESLDLDQGGDLADNLDALYEYIVKSLQSIDGEKPLQTLSEVKNLLQEVYSGWTQIDDPLES